MDKNKILIWSVSSIFGIALLALLVLWLVATIKEKRGYGGSEYQDTGTNNTTGTAGTVGPAMPIFPLRWGSGGSNCRDVQTSQSYVRGIQVLCNNWIHAGLDVDGIWGSKTEAAVRRLKTARYYKKTGSAQMNTTEVFAQNIVTIPGASRVQVPSLASYNKMQRWNKSHVGQSYTFLV